MNRRHFLSMLGAAPTLAAMGGQGASAQGLLNSEDLAQQAAAVWQAWKGAYLQPSGRVVDGLQQNASHSEGQGYGAVLAVEFADQEALTRILDWTEANLALRGDSLLAWRYLPDASNPVPDLNNASDGDLFYAWALVRAAARFNQRAYLQRAQQTAQIVGERLRAPVTTTPALAEFDCGIMEGRGDAEAWAAHHAVVSDWAAGRPDAHIPEGESFTHMQARFVPFVEQLVAQHAHTERNFLLVAHGSLLYHMLPLVLANVSSAFIGQQSMRNCLLIDTTVQNGQLICAKWDQTVLLV